jgi:hypothetical protein
VPSGFNFRRFLSKAEDPLERLAELGRETAHRPAPPFAPLKLQSDAAPVRGASVDEKVVDLSVAKARRAGQPRRRPPSYVWRSQVSRAGRASWADMPTNF